MRPPKYIVADPRSADRDALIIARNAFVGWRRSLEEGELDAFPSHLAQNVRFIVNLPFDQWRGEHQGRSKVRELLAFEREQLNSRPVLTLEDIFANGNRVILEWSTTGTVMGRSCRPDARNLLLFEIESGEIVFFREFYGSLD